MRTLVRSDNDSLVISLKKPAAKNETRTFEIVYQGIPADGLIISKNKYGDRTFFGDNWPNRAHNWIPCKMNRLIKPHLNLLLLHPLTTRLFQTEN